MVIVVRKAPVKPTKIAKVVIASVHGAALIMKSKRAAIAVGKVLVTATVFGVGADMGGVRAYPSISAMGITTAIAAGLRGAQS